jgi:ornithine cyclodeaminase/alanine dehydrogenase-like protein (mu-crystallin family)
MLVLSQAEVRALLDLDELLGALERALVELSAGRASVPPRTAAFVPGRGLLGAMPGYVDGVLAAKLVSLFEGNVELPSHQAVVAVFDPENGQPLALMDGTFITAIRTGATSAVSVRALARADARALAVVGTGVQARSHLEAVRLVRPFQVVCVGGRDERAAAALAAEFGADVAGIEEAVRGADVVCLCTHAEKPVLRWEWLAPGTQVTSVGSSHELDADTVEQADVLAVESRATAFQPFPAGAPELAGRDPDTAVELGEVLAGTRPGRTDDAQLTVYKSTGHAVEDAAAAALVLRRAQRDGIGTTVAL